MALHVVHESMNALANLDMQQVTNTVEALRAADRIFCVGNGGGYAHAMHFASDLRKIAGKQAFSFDNVAEMTARINDQGWESAWFDWVHSHNYDAKTDIWFGISCGGSTVPGISQNIGAYHYGIVGANGQWMGNRIVIPSTSTPVIEGCQSVIAHHLVEALCA